MPRYKLRTLLILLAIGPPIIWVGFRAVLVSRPPQTILSPAEFANLIASGNVIIHVDTDWSIQAAASRPIVKRLQSRMAVDPRCSTIRWRRFECYDPSTLLWQALDDWLGNQLGDQQSVGRPVQSGYGSLIWVKDGRVVDSLAYSANEDADELFARTLIAFKEK